MSDSRDRQTAAGVDESWPMVEEAVFRLFDDLAEKPDHVAIGPRLAELGWSEIEAEYPVKACELLFRAQGRSLAHTDCLDRVMLAELAALLDEQTNGLGGRESNNAGVKVVLPNLADGCTPGSGGSQVSGIVLGPLNGRLVVPVSTATGAVSVTVVDADQLAGERLDTFDGSTHWTRVGGPVNGRLTEASIEWNRAMSAAQRALATELVAVADQALRIAVDHISIRVQFGVPIGSFQSPRHALADAAAGLEGTRALLDETWLYGGQMSAMVAKAAAGRAHRAVADAALQVCGAIGLTAEHELHRYVARGFQIDALCGSHQQLEALLADRLFDIHSRGRALPAITACG